MSCVLVWQKPVRNGYSHGYRLFSGIFPLKMAAALGVLGVLTFGAVEAMGPQRHCIRLTGQLGPHQA